jgi:hypothetical protein
MSGGSIGIRARGGSLFWVLLVLALQATRAAVAEDAAKPTNTDTTKATSAEAGGAADSTSEKYSSAVAIAEELAVAKQRFELDAHRIAQLRSLRSQVQGLKGELARAEGHVVHRYYPTALQ